MAVLLGVAGAACLAGFTQGLAGFGSTLVALPLLGLFLDARVSTPLGCLVAFCINVCLVARLRGRVAMGDLGLLLLASLPGMALGAMLLGRAPDALLKGFLGIFVVGFALASLMRRGLARGGGGGYGLAAAGLAAGFLGVSIGVNGPPVVAWASRRAYDRDALRATLAGYFLVAGVFIVGAQFSQGLVTARVWELFLASLPGMAAGLAGGAALCGRIDERHFRRVVHGLLAAAGGALCVQALDKVWG